MRDRGTTKSGFIGEESPGHSETDRLLDTDSDGSTKRRLRAEGGFENQFECRRNSGEIIQNHGQRPEKIADNHGGHEFFGDPSDSADTPNYHESGQKRDGQP